jgi:hypothetical protein
MRWLLFLSRLAFICNVFFLLAVSLQFTRWLRNADLEATIIILGYVLVLVLNPFVNFCVAILYFTKREKLANIPKYLLLANLVFLLLQIIYVIYLNDR